MKKAALVLAMASMLGLGACTDMSPTEAGMASGAAIGAAGGAAVGAITGGSAVTGAVIGGMVGTAAGGYKGCQEEGKCD